MKILVLTLTGSANTKIHLIIDKIVSYQQEKEDTVVRMLNGDWHYVKETAEFITRQLVDANVSLDTVFNRKEHK